MGQPVDIALGASFVSTTNPLPVAIISGGGAGGGSSSPSDTAWVDSNGVYFVYRDIGVGTPAAIRIDTWASFSPTAPVKSAGASGIGDQADAAATSAAGAQSLVSLQKGILARQLPFTITQTTFAVTTAAQQFIAANPGRKYLQWMVIGAADVTIAPGASGVTVGAGLIYQAGGAGKQGASEEFQVNAPTNAFQCIAGAAGSTLIVWEGA